MFLRTATNREAACINSVAMQLCHLDRFVEDGKLDRVERSVCDVSFGAMVVVRELV